jgi:hypothetical protein
VDPRAGLDDVEKRQFLTLPGHELRPLRRSVRSQSLYRLRHPGSLRKMTAQGESTPAVHRLQENLRFSWGWNIVQYFR